MEAIGLALACSAAWGLADFLAGTAARRAALVSVLVLSQSAGMALLLAAWGFHGGALEAGAVAWGLAAGACGAVGLAAFYWAMTRGRISVVSPITACGAVLPLGLGLASGERPGAVALAGAGVALAGAALASTGEAGEARADERPALAAAALSALALGGFLYTVDKGAGGGHALAALVGVRAGSLTLVAGAALALRRPPRLARGLVPIVVLAGLLDTGANGLFALASQRGYLSLVSVLASLYPVMTVLLARVVLRERLGTLERAGVVAALAGVALISAR